MNPATPTVSEAEEQRPGLSLERTELAWQRTALSLGAGLIGGVRLALRTRDPATNPLTWIVVAVAALYAGFLWRYVLRRHTHDRSVAAVGLTALLTLLTGICAVVFVVSQL